MILKNQSLRQRKKITKIIQSKIEMFNYYQYTFAVAVVVVVMIVFKFIFPKSMHNLICSNDFFARS